MSITIIAESEDMLVKRATVRTLEFLSEMLRHILRRSSRLETDHLRELRLEAQCVECQAERRMIVSDHPAIWVV
jgi:hypothetical protein